MRDGQRILSGLLWGDVEAVDASLLHHVAVLGELPLHTHVVEVAEEELVAYTQAVRLGIHHLSPNILVFVSHFIHMRVGYTVGTDESIAIEIVVGGIVVVVVTAIGIDGASLCILSVEGLVDEVPDETALELGVFAHQVPILLKATTRVTHGMVVLTLYEWFLVFGLVALGIPLTPFL